MNTLLVLSLLFMNINGNQSLLSDYKTINDRSYFNYEITKMEVINNYLHIEGWGLVNQNQNLTGVSSHEFTLFLDAKKDKRIYKTELIDHDLTDIMKDRRYSSCRINEVNNKKCNYNYKNVGFKTHINLLELNVNESYQLFLGIHTKQTKLKLKSPLFYFEEKSLNKHYDDRDINIRSDFKLSQFRIYHDALVATPQPSISTPTNQINIGSECSPGYKNRAYHDPDTLYKNILGKEMYKGLVSYYKVKVKDNGCKNLRRRVGEGATDSNIIIYVPGTFVTFQGQPLSIDVISTAAPIISANDIEIEQYSHFDPHSYASAYDIVDKDITNKINIHKNTVNTRIPGIYQTCYSVKNSNNKRSELCINVKVIKVKTRIRYINNKSFSHAKLRLWKENYFKDFLINVLNQ